MATRKSSKARASAGPAASASAVLSGVQQLLLAGMGAAARAQREGPAAFTDAVGEGLRMIGKSRDAAEKMLRDALDAAQESVQSRLDGAREQAGETWDNLEVLFQTRVQRAMQQIGVPTADEIRLLTRRVTELNDAVKTLTIRVDGGAAARRPTTARTARTSPRKQTARGRSPRRRAN